MPPKKPNEPSKKNELKKKDKTIEDKTFGLKNKKGSKQQKFIKTVVHQVKNSGTKTKLDEKPKEAKKKEVDELNLLFKPVQQTVGKGVDPKSVVCAFFKQGTCGKGDKCKFSHDLNVGRKSEKKNLYEDVRDDDDNMDTWDEEKLEEVINKKHAESNKSKPTTSIICKHFVDAVENSKYGWFWSCPNGGDKCMYKHALPPGFVLKKDQKKLDKKDELSIEELVEKERSALGLAVTRVTLESFLKWKERKRKEKVAILKSTQNKKKNDFKQGQMLGISGRELFEFNPDLVTGDDDEADDVTYTQDSDNEEEEEVQPARVREIDFSMWVMTDTDGTGTQLDKGDVRTVGMVNGASDDAEAHKLDEAGGGDDITETDATKNGDTNIEIDEDLFDGEDLDALEDDLDALDLED